MSEPLKYAEHGVVSWAEYEKLDKERGQAAYDRDACRSVVNAYEREASEARRRAHFLENSVAVWSRDFELLQGRYFQLEARARALVNAMHELPDGDWTEVLAALEEALASPSP